MYTCMAIILWQYTNIAYNKIVGEIQEIIAKFFGSNISTYVKL